MRRRLLLLHQRLRPRSFSAAAQANCTALEAARHDAAEMVMQLRSLWQLLRSTQEGRFKSSNTVRPLTADERAAEIRHNAIFETYGGVARRASAESRLEVSSADDDGNQNTDETTHGELGFSAVRSILCTLEEYGLGAGAEAAATTSMPCELYDLGSGVGRPVCAAALLRPALFSRCVGIELLGELHDGACAAAAKLGAEAADVEFARRDFLLEPQDSWAARSTRVLLVHGTCYGEATTARIAAACAWLAPGTFVVSVSRPLPAPCLQLLGQRSVRASWGDATVFFQWRYATDAADAADSRFHANAHDNTAEQAAVRDAGVLRRVVSLLARRADDDATMTRGGGDGEHDDALRINAACLVAFAAASEQSAHALVAAGALEPLLATLNLESTTTATAAAPAAPVLASTLMALAALAAQPALASRVAAAASGRGIAILSAWLPRDDRGGGSDDAGTAKERLPAPLAEVLLVVLLRCATACPLAAETLREDPIALTALSFIGAQEGCGANLPGAAAETALAIVRVVDEQNETRCDEKRHEHK